MKRNLELRTQRSVLEGKFLMMGHPWFYPCRRRRSQSPSTSKAGTIACLSTWIAIWARWRLKNLTIDAGDEDDFVGFFVATGTTLNFSDIVSISTGEGSDLLELSIAGTVTIAKALTINSGADSDVVTINVDGALTAKAETSFFTGDGSDELLLAGDGLVTFDKTLKVDMGEDSDKFTVFLDRGILVKAAATITMADGDDSVGFSGKRRNVGFPKGVDR